MLQASHRRKIWIEGRNIGVQGVGRNIGISRKDPLSLGKNLLIFLNCRPLMKERSCIPSFLPKG